MKTLLVLYLIYLSWGTSGAGRVSFLEMSRYLRRSKSQTKSDMLFLAKSGLVDVVALFSDKGAKKYFVQLSETGEDYLMQNFDAAIDMYHLHVAETILSIQEASKEANYEPRKVSKKELEAINAGQMKMEGF